ELVGTPSCLFPAKLRVKAGDPGSSFLIDKLKGHLSGTPVASCGQTNEPMPMGGAALPEAQIDQVVAWIQSGAVCPPGPDGGVDGGQDAGTDGGILEMPVTALAVSPDAGIFLAGVQLPVQLTLGGPAPVQGELVTLEASDPSILGADSELFIPAGATGASLAVLGKRPGAASLIATGGGKSVQLSLVVGGLYVTELMANPNASDPDGMQWVKVYNGGTFPVDLSQYAFGAGANHYTESLAQLSGVLQPQSCAVVGGPQSNAGNGFPSFTDVIHFSPTLPTCWDARTAMGFGLFSQRASTVDATTVPLDSVEVGSSLNPSFPGNDTGLAAPVPAGSSLSRINHSQWSPTGSPTPNACP
ncbi:MAG TPA: hypothetical protein VH208_03550, partial [Myxococcaceae bacterium]|nr:hypothetical protein [Myxococcaceae bacterium]